MKISLQDILIEVQERIAYFYTLPKRKRFRRKYWEAFTWAIKFEGLLKDAIAKEAKIPKKEVMPFDESKNLENADEKLDALTDEQKQETEKAFEGGFKGDKR